MVGRSGQRPLNDADLLRTLQTLNDSGGSRKKTAEAMGRSDRTVRRHLAKTKTLLEEEPPHPFAADGPPPIGTSTEAKWVIDSLPNNTYRFGAFGDLHAGSKYCRWDVREDMMQRAEDFGAQCIFDTGNWIDGEMRFNRYDLEATGLTNQLNLLAARYPKTDIPTYAVTGDDHEGWYGGIDVGKYCERTMQDAGHKWYNLGYMEADIVLRNCNTGVTSVLRVAHPGGGSAYAVSYRPQKIIESLEGGEKPQVLLIGHYHKLDAGTFRNVWYAQTGTQQDQTSYMRKKPTEAHVGGLLVGLDQDPETGAITGFMPIIRRYFSRGYYLREGRINERWSGHGPIKQVPRAANIPD